MGYIEIPTDNIEETKKFYRLCLAGNLRKVKEEEEEEKKGEKYWLIKNAGIKGAITSKREDNQKSNSYILYYGRINRFLSQKQGAKVVINKKEISEGFYATLQESATKYIWFMAKQKISK